jgi:hypothetical protein
MASWSLPLGATVMNRLGPLSLANCPIITMGSWPMFPGSSNSTNSCASTINWGRRNLIRCIICGPVRRYCRGLYCPIWNQRFLLRGTTFFPAFWRWRTAGAGAVGDERHWTGDSFNLIELLYGLLRLNSSITVKRILQIL